MGSVGSDIVSEDEFHLDFINFTHKVSAHDIAKNVPNSIIVP